MGFVKTLEKYRKRNLKSKNEKFKRKILKFINENLKFQSTKRRPDEYHLFSTSLESYIIIPNISCLIYRVCPVINLCVYR